MISNPDENDLSGIDVAAAAVDNFVKKGTAIVLLFLLTGTVSAFILAFALPFAVAAILDVARVPMYYTPEALVAEPWTRIFAVFLGFAFAAVTMLKHTTFADIEESDLPR